MAKFRTLSNGIEGLLIADNYRHLQPIGNRKVFVRSVSSRFVDFERLKMEANENDESEWYYSNE